VWRYRTVVKSGKHHGDDKGQDDKLIGNKKLNTNYEHEPPHDVTMETTRDKRTGLLSDAEHRITTVEEP